MDLLSKIKAMTRQEKMTAIGLCGTIILTALTVAMIISVFVSGSNGTPGQTQPEDTATQLQSTTLPVHDTTAAATVAATVETFEETTASTTEETTAPAEQDDDPQASVSGDGEKVDISSVITGDGETNDRTLGIDVSKYQGTIDWAQVADYGIEFAIIRVGYRTKVDGRIVADTNARYNLQEAQKYGIKLGAYFFSTAVTEEEAIEEANWVADYISRYSITYPVAFNCEGFSDPENRQHSLSKSQRTDLALAFLKTVHQRGYVPMFYAAKVELEGQAQWETSRLEKQYKIWVAQYPALPYPQTQNSSYSGKHHMWQFTPAGSIPGIPENVDINIAYFGYNDPESPKDETPPETVEPDPEALMTFTAVSETVTAKIETNLRDIPSQGEESTVMYTLKNGQTATRTGISDSGWSRVEFEGKTYYAVSSYLTTDLNYQPPQQPTQPEQSFQTQFTPVNEQVTAKEAVNLRDIPSMENSQVIHQLVNGEIAIRTGINNDVGWSRVEWNGQVLYCISSYLTTPAPTPTETTPAE